MSFSRKGFTLIELTVVVVILGILATLAIPGYQKSVEVSRAGDAQGMLATVATANRMYSIDKAQYCCATGILSGSNFLVTEKYLPDSGWSQLSYNFYACLNSSSGACCAAGTIACAQRKPGFGTYSNWIYRISDTGVCTPVNGAPGCVAM